MSDMCKFKIGDQVRVIEPGDPHNDKVGKVFARDPESHYCYDVIFESGDTNFYAAAHLTLAPGDHE